MNLQRNPYQIHNLALRGNLMGQKTMQWQIPDPKREKNLSAQKTYPQKPSFLFQNDIKYLQSKQKLKDLISTWPALQTPLNEQKPTKLTQMWRTSQLNNKEN